MHTEFTGPSDEQPGAVAVATADGISIVDLETTQEALLAWDLGAGEAEAITLARQTRATWFRVDG